MNLGIDPENKEKSRNIIHSFGEKLKKLLLGEQIEVTFCDPEKTKQQYVFDEQNKLTFVLFGIIYASRCNNFHGNVAARMNSINANVDTFKMYTDIFSAGVYYFSNTYEQSRRSVRCCIRYG